MSEMRNPVWYRYGRGRYHLTLENGATLCGGRYFLSSSSDLTNGPVPVKSRCKKCDKNARQLAQLLPELIREPKP